MKKLLLAGAAIAVLYFGLGRSGALRQFTGAPSTPVQVAQSDTVGRAFTTQASGTQVTGEGTVTRLLSDDNDGSRHQRFIIRIFHQWRTFCSMSETAIQ